MRTDIVIAGGGLAGSAAAAMLGRAGYGVALIDPHKVYPPDFRAEKIDGTQARILHRTGLSDAVLRVATFDGECWIARFGRLIEKRHGDQHGFHYDTLVNAIRRAIPPHVEFVQGKVADIATSEDTQRVTLADGTVIEARLAVVANGLNVGLRDKLGMRREITSKCHSIMLGFDLVPADGTRFAAPALTYYGERLADRTAYITLFPIGAAMRANLCVYREMDDPWLRQFRQAPRDTLTALMPGLAPIIGAFEIPGEVKIRPADLYVTHGVRKAGVVLLGDAFATSCPAAGTGTGKVFTDVERLCNVHVPRWLATPGMGAAKIAAFYDDVVKRAYDQYAEDRAYDVRSLAIDPAPYWAAQRWLRFLARIGRTRLREWRARLQPSPAHPIGRARLMLRNLLGMFGMA